MNLRNIILAQIVFLALFCGLGHASTYYFTMGSSSQYGCLVYKYINSAHYTSSPGAVATDFTFTDGVATSTSGSATLNDHCYAMTLETYAYISNSWTRVGQKSGVYWTGSQISSKLSGSTSAWPSECVEPNPCTDKEGEEAGMDGHMTIYAKFTYTTCQNDCEVTGNPLANSISSYDNGDGWISNIQDAKYTGNECGEEGSPEIVTPTPDEDPEDPEYPFPEFCDKQEDECRTYCKNGTAVNECDMKTGAYECLCTEPTDSKDPEKTPEKPVEKEKEDVPDTATDSDSAIIKNQGKQIEQGNYIASAIESNGKNLEGIVTNTKGILDAINGGAIGKSILKGIEDGIEDGLKGGMSDVARQMDDVGEALTELQEGWEGTDSNYAPFEEDGSLLSGEVTRLGENITGIKDDIADVTGIDLNGSSSLPVVVIPAVGGFPEHTIDMSQWSEVFDMIASVVPFIAYFIAALIIFG